MPLNHLHGKIFSARIEMVTFRRNYVTVMRTKTQLKLLDIARETDKTLKQVDQMLKMVGKLADSNISDQDSKVIAEIQSRLEELKQKIQAFGQNLSDND